MIQKIKELPVVQKMVAQYDHLPRRDQQALIALTVALFIAIIYFAVWRPASAFHHEAVTDRTSAEALVVWMEGNRDVIQRISARDNTEMTGTRIEDGRALMSTVTRSAGEAGLSLQRFEPSGEDGIRVWLENAPFNQVAGWLETLNADYGIAIDQAALDRGKSPGLVSVRLTLQI
ncbi:type II secretion system protein GspM [Marinobacter caseinilyticus]|uniref:type II secretion system protein GspM n=1 Tax=Marinobacter caseinilyticus TaxID=2692195 RepID=UPI00140833F9|nr:type II secretion system protein M [Marinobacter caseinilyticus]